MVKKKVSQLSIPISMASPTTMLGRKSSKRILIVKPVTIGSELQDGKTSIEEVVKLLEVVAVAAEELLKVGGTSELVVLLLHDLIPVRHGVGKKQIRMVLESIPKLCKYLRKEDTIVEVKTKN